MEGGESEEQKNNTIPNEEHKAKNSIRTKKMRKKGKKIKKAKIWIDINPPLSPSEAPRIARLDDKNDNRLLVRVPQHDSYNDILEEAKIQLDEEAPIQSDEEASYKSDEEDSNQSDDEVSNQSDEEASSQLDKEAPIQSN